MTNVIVCEHVAGCCSADDVGRCYRCHRFIFLPDRIPDVAGAIRYICTYCAKTLKRSDIVIMSAERVA